MPVCDICATSLTDIRVIRRGSLKRTPERPLGGGMSLSEAWCPNCEIFLTKKTFNGEVEDWKSSYISHDELVSEVSNHQQSKLEEDVLFIDSNEKHSTAKERWDKFISMKKETDKLFQYLRKDQHLTITGYVIKRANHLIGFYIHNIDGFKNKRTDITTR